MTTTEFEAPDSLLRHLAARALTRARSAPNTAERIGWLNRYNELLGRAAELVEAGAEP